MEIVDSYEITFENTKIPISIYKEEGDMVPTYEVGILDVSEYTGYIIEKIKEDLLREGIFEKSEDTNFDYDELKKVYVKKVNELLKYYLPMLGLEEKDKLITYIVQKSLDLGFVDILISDSGIEELTINGSQFEVMIYHRKHGWLKTNLKFLNDDEIKNIATRVALENKKFFSNLNPLLDAHLRGGHRVNATMDPISTRGSTMTIRRFSDKPWTITDLMMSGTANAATLALIWIAIENELSIIVAGGTGSGKTSYLNSISTFMPANQRIISVEDTREIRLPGYAHWVPMEARQPNPEGKGGISMLDLIVNSLRMRPDRIIIGEIRKKEEAEVLFEAMRTGHSVYGSFHATNAEETVIRLSSPPIEIPKMTLSSLGLIVIQHRDRRNGKRMTLQVAEMDREGNESVVIQYSPTQEKQIFKKKPTRMIKMLEEFQGMSEKEFFKSLKERMMVLEYLKAFKINQIDQVGIIVNKYSQNKEELFKQIKKDMRSLKK